MSFAQAPEWFRRPRPVCWYRRPASCTDSRRASSLQALEQYRCPRSQCEHTITWHPHLSQHSNRPSLDGAAYFFGRNAGGDGNWGGIQKVWGRALNDGDEFGLSVCVDGGTAVAGAPLHDAGNWDGAAFVFHEDAGSWTHKIELNALDHPMDARLGQSVAISGDIAVVGAGAHYYEGSAFVFDRNAAVFADGFESGGVASWSNRVP